MAGKVALGLHPVPVLVDTDPGLDDALALLLALRSPEFRVEAVTTVAGNVPVDVGTRNVARILGVIGPTSAPHVAEGATGPRAGPLVTATHVHGEDGLGGVGRLRRADGTVRFPEADIGLQPAGARDLIVETARRWPGALVVIALGPMTNLAAAIDRDAAALRGVRTVVAMGGAVAVGGNATAAAEYNVFADPESAARVLAAGLPLTLVPLDVTREVVWSAKAVERLSRAIDPVAQFAHAVGRAALGLLAPSGEAGLTLHDPLAVGVALDASVVEAESLPVAVEITGTHTRGMTVVDRRPGQSERATWPRCRVARRVDARRFLRLFEERIWPGSA
jgi:purine nucleosidase/pyrimidine-specific ribonucleoside hydrolase